MDHQKEFSFFACYQTNTNEMNLYDYDISSFNLAPERTRWIHFDRRILSNRIRTFLQKYSIIILCNRSFNQNLYFLAEKLGLVAIMVFVGFSSQNLARQKTFAQKRKVRAFPHFCCA